MSDLYRLTKTQMVEGSMHAMNGGTYMGHLVPVSFDEPMLGLATTRQLIEELTTRIEMDGMLDYRTVDAALEGSNE